LQERRRTVLTASPATNLRTVSTAFDANMEVTL